MVNKWLIWVFQGMWIWYSNNATNTSSLPPSQFCAVHTWTLLSLWPQSKTFLQRYDWQGWSRVAMTTEGGACVGWRGRWPSHCCWSHIPPSCLTYRWNHKRIHVIQRSTYHHGQHRMSPNDIKLYRSTRRKDQSIYKLFYIYIKSVIAFLNKMAFSFIRGCDTVLLLFLASIFWGWCITDCCLLLLRTPVTLKTKPTKNRLTSYFRDILQVLNIFQQSMLSVMLF